ncbi:16S rRNA processing protein RimM [Herbaspirillum sp. Sphag1AN]|uniref:ribosome maturation factor RimM n=1 Tax=unclassified Herbaspirillum TaxID=2624150 RepID=UPI00160E594C|nr:MULTISPECIES: ribosome maturation factor RimM [unclassified Herbaspirillum]MBB3210835.1 16S rRNA processing protein RimM [Herbaspirillum sp. Sphag1AN]MBB3244465.1 16S rRNA processing protein RimM [Herbaspirillum sp. Sphag64]
MQSTQSAAGVSVPSDLVTVGYISGAYGIQGWVRVKPYSADADALLGAKTWWLDKPELRDVEMMQAKDHSGDVVARLMGVAGRDAAEALKGAVVQISRSHFPALSDGEFYWVDLIGLAVENIQGESLGVVADLMDNGAHPILRVVRDVVSDTGADASQSAAGSKTVAETLIPFVDQFVKTVALTEKKILVDWGLDY